MVNRKNRNRNKLEPPEAKRKRLLESYQSGHYQDAEKMARTLTKKFPRSLFGWKVLGAILGQTARQSEALTCCQTSIDIAPHDADAHNNLGNILKDLGRRDEAEAAYSKAITLKPNHAKALNNLGILFKEQGKLEDARACYVKGITQAPGFYECHNNLGVVLQELGELTQASDAFYNALKIKPDYPAALNNLGNAFKEASDLNQAEEYYSKALSSDPSYTEANNNLANLLLDQKRFVEAERYFNQVIALNPSSAEACSGLGQVYANIENPEKAAFFFEKALELRPDDSLGATLELAVLGKGAIPERTPFPYMLDFYRKKAKKFKGEKDDQDQYRGHLLIKRAITSTHDRNNKRSFLDLGCGTGSLGGFLSGYASTLYGVDLSPDMLSEAQKSGSYDSLHREDLISYLEGKSYKFDTVVAAAVLIHFLDLDPIFGLVKERLSGIGKFVFSAFEEIEEEKKLNSFLLYSHNPNYIEMLAARYDFKVVYKEKDIHEYHQDTPVMAITYALEKSTKL